jgi:hypothetical protein
VKKWEANSRLLLHTEVRWLTSGKVLVRLFTLGDEVMSLLSEFSFKLSSRLCDRQWFQHFSYLIDIFSSLNGLNLPLQGASVTVFSAYNKTEAKLKKNPVFGTWCEETLLSASFHFMTFF